MKKINQLVTSIVSKLPNRNNFIFWILVALFFKSMFFGYKAWLEPNRFANTHYVNMLPAEATDTYSYFGPMENYKNNGSYYTPEHEDYRMPGYGIVYLILRMVLSIRATVTTIVFLQLLLSALSVYVLAQIAYMVFKRESIFVLTFFLYAVSTFVSLYDIALLTESFTASAFIFSVYYLLKSDKDPKYLLLSGFFLTWSTFMRPVMSLVFFIFVLYVVVKNAKSIAEVFSKAVKPLLLLIIPFILIDGAWMYRNYQHYHRIIPLTKTRFYTSTETTYLSHLNWFIQAFGGSVAGWEPDADIQFFYQRKDFKIKKDVELPAYVYTSKFNRDSLIQLRTMIQSIRTDSLDSIKKRALDVTLMRTLDRYTKSIQTEKPFLYYFYARWRFFKTFLIHSGTRNLFYKGSSELNKPELFVKVFYTLLYILVMIGGFAGSFILLFRGLKNANFFLIGSIGLYFAFVTPIIVRMDQIRYFVPGYPFFVIALVYLLVVIADRVRSRSAV